MVSGYSKFFTFEELTDSEGFPELVEQNRKEAMLFVNSGKRLSKLLESIRHILGDKPTKSNSGFRGKALNKAIYVKIFMKQGYSKKKAEELAEAKTSNHSKFEADDLRPPIGMTVDQAFEKIKKAHKEGLLPDLRKVLHEGSWLHIEVSMSVGDYRGFFVSKDGNKTWEKVA